MKTKIVLLFASAFLFFSSCMEDEISVETLTQTQQIAYTETHLKALGEKTLILAQDQEFRSLLYAKVSEQFDGDNNVLFEHLFDANTHYKKGGDVQKSLDAFKGIEGVDYFPQVFIPFFDELKSRRREISSSGVKEKEPVIILSVLDHKDDLYDGYILDESGVLRKHEQSIDEDYARNNEVWVISLNERVFSLEDVEIVDTSSSINKNNNTESGARSQSWWCAGDVNYNLSGGTYIGCLGITCHKESWAKGKSEVNIRAFISNWAFATTRIVYYENRQYEGRTLINMHRGDVKNGKGWNIDRAVFSNEDWTEFKDVGNYFHYVIFEYDAWPRGKQDVSFQLGGSSYKLKKYVRTSDSFYDTGSVQRYNWGYVQIDNDCIFYTGRAI